MFLNTVNLASFLEFTLSISLKAKLSTTCSLN